MKNKSRLLVIAIAAAAVFMWLPPFALLTEAKSAEWAFSKTIQAEDIAEYRSVLLDEDVYAQALEGLIDLRIIDDEGQFIPYYIEAGTTDSKEKETVYSSEIVDNFMILNDRVFDF